MWCSCFSPGVWMTLQTPSSRRRPLAHWQKNEPSLFTQNSSRPGHTSSFSLHSSTSEGENLIWAHSIQWHFYSNITTCCVLKVVTSCVEARHSNPWVYRIRHICYTFRELTQLIVKKKDLKTAFPYIHWPPLQSELQTQFSTGIHPHNTNGLCAGQT